MTTMLCATIVQAAMLLTGAEAPAAEATAPAPAATTAPAPAPTTASAPAPTTASAPAATTAPAPAPTTASAESYAEAHRAAVETGKPMVVLVSTNWCVPCQTMKRRVLPRVRAHASFQRVAYAVVNPDEQSELAQQLTGGGPIPQLVMYRKTANGWVRQKLVGGQTEEAVEQFINEGLASDDSEKKAEAAKAAETPAADHATAHRTDPAAEEKKTRQG